MEPINQKSNRDSNGKFKKGCSGNPTGRKPTLKGMTAYIDLKTNDMKDVVDKAVEMLTEGNSREQMFAVGWISDRRWGRPLQTVETDTISHVVIGSLDDNRPDEDSETD